MKKTRAPSKGPFICYALEHSISKRTYTGQTNNFQRRIRQHNGSLSGGARYTHVKKGSWSPIFHVCGFETKRAVLQFELAMKKRKIRKAYTRGPSGRVRQLQYLLSLGKLNDESHSPFAANGITVRCFISLNRYLAFVTTTLDAFTRDRDVQRVRFSF